MEGLCVRQNWRCIKECIQGGQKMEEQRRAGSLDTLDGNGLGRSLFEILYDVRFGRHLYYT